MDTIANRCKIIKKIRNNQIKSDINASTVGEKLLMDIFPAIDGFFIASCDFSSTELKMVLGVRLPMPSATVVARKPLIPVAGKRERSRCVL